MASILWHSEKPRISSALCTLWVWCTIRPSYHSSWECSGGRSLRCKAECWELRNYLHERVKWPSKCQWNRASPTPPATTARGYALLSQSIALGFVASVGFGFSSEHEPAKVVRGRKCHHTWSECKGSQSEPYRPQAQERRREAHKRWWAAVRQRK